MVLCSSSHWQVIPGHFLGSRAPAPVVAAPENQCCKEQIPTLSSSFSYFSFAVVGKMNSIWARPITPGHLCNDLNTGPFCVFFLCLWQLLIFLPVSCPLFLGSPKCNSVGKQGCGGFPRGWRGCPAARADSSSSCWGVAVCPEVLEQCPELCCKLTLQTPQAHCTYSQELIFASSLMHPKTFLITYVNHLCSACIHIFQSRTSQTETREHFLYMRWGSHG